MNQAQQIYNHIRGALLADIIASVLLTTGLGLYFYRSILQRLRNVQHNILCLNNRGALAPPAGGTDEIADLDEQVHESAQRIRELQAYKTQIVTLIGRQFSAPLMAIDKSLQHLKASAALDERMQGLVEGASTSLSRLIRLANQLLDLDSIEEATFDLKLEPVLLSALVKISCEAVEKIAHDSDITIETQLSETTLEADRDRLAQVLINLLSNAIKFSPPHSTVTVAASIEDKRVNISVIDRGRGIPQDFQNRMFQRFAQAETSDAAEHKGFGLGLSIIKSILDAHGGEIATRSAIGRGTTFTIQLPLTQAKHEAGPVAATKVPSSSWTQRIIVDAPTWKKGLIIISLPLIMQLLFLASIGALLAGSNARVEKASQIRLLTSASTSLVRREMHIIALGCFYHEFQAPWMLQEYNSQKAVFEADRLRLQKLPNVNLIQTEAVLRFFSTASLWLENLLKMPQTDLSARQILAPTEGSSEIETTVLEAAKALDGMRLRAAQLADEQTTQSADARNQITALIFTCLLANTLLAVALAYFTWSAISKRIEKVKSNAEQLVDGGPLSAPGAGLDEIGQIDRSFYISGTGLLELEQFKQQLVGVIGHDLRTPLTTILGLFDLLASDPLKTLPNECVQEAQAGAEEVKKLISLINEALAVEKAKLPESNTAASYGRGALSL